MIRPNILNTMYPTVLPKPAGAKILPGPLVITKRPSPGGAPPPTPKEALTPIKKVEYREIHPTELPAYPNPFNPPVQGHTYVTNPRKDGTTPILLSPIQTFEDRSLSIAHNQRVAASVAASVPKIHELTQNDTGKVGINGAAQEPVKAATVISAETSPFHWGALLIVGAIAWILIRR
jgi:hypothetical protein